MLQTWPSHFSLWGSRVGDPNYDYQLSILINAHMTITCMFNISYRHKNIFLISVNLHLLSLPLEFMICLSLMSIFKKFLFHPFDFRSQEPGLSPVALLLLITLCSTDRATNGNFLAEDWECRKTTKGAQCELNLI